MEAHNRMTAKTFFSKEINVNETYYTFHQTRLSAHIQCKILFLWGHVSVKSSNNFFYFFQELHDH